MVYGVVKSLPASISGHWFVNAKPGAGAIPWKHETRLYSSALTFL